MPKPKPADIEGLHQLLEALTEIKSLATGAVAIGEHVQKAVDAHYEQGRQQVQAHLARKDLRPKVNFKPMTKGHWAVTIADSVYYLGPRDGIMYDEDEPQFYWKHAGKEYAARSMFQALIGVMQDYFNPM